MYIVRYDNPDPDFPFWRQSPSGSCIWGDFKFVFNQEIEECDYWVVEDALLHPTKCRCPPQHTLFITREPASIRWYNPFFLRQFHSVMTFQSKVIHRNVIRGQPALPWYVGMRWDGERRRWKEDCPLDYDKLKALSDPKKDRLVSVITSDKTMTKGHRERLAFVRRLEKEFGNDLDVFITSNNGLEDKWDAIGRYRYHITIENGVFPDYWSEKMADPLLGLCHPIYHGCPNISDYFPEGSFTPFDFRKFDSALETIRETVYSDARERGLPALHEAKRMVMDEYNPFPTLVKTLSGLPRGSEKRDMVLRPEAKVYSRSWRERSKGLVGVLRNELANWMNGPGLS
ncbi:MAG: Glycosyltransferase family 10 (fucosyltransferase) [Methanomassiliicoccales archaeon PtaB.Bin215]|nr:MAG: Glycosyltransferase family 10 (fucosyltransferase) [Methanomassiliicoccales archaeon PtaB.Bin215]